MKQNKIKSNEDKTQFMVFGTRNQLNYRGTVGKKPNIFTNSEAIMVIITLC